MSADPHSGVPERSAIGAVYGPTINRAMQRDSNDREQCNTAPDMLAIWITNGQQEYAGA
jgi:hypothetical protein